MPLARLEKRTFTAGETLTAEIEIANFGPKDMKAMQPAWRITDTHGVIASGTLPTRDIATGALTPLGEVSVALAQDRRPRKLELNVRLPGTDYANHWALWVYPADPAPHPPADVIVTGVWNDKTKAELAAGKKVLFLPAKKPKNALRVAFCRFFGAPCGFPRRFRIRRACSAIRSIRCLRGSPPSLTQIGSGSIS